MPQNIYGTPSTTVPGGDRRSAGTQRSCRQRRRRSASVWPLTLDDRHPDVGILPGWLLGAIAKIITLYTAPGQKVLLLAPPGDRRLRRAEWDTAPAGSTSDLLTGLIDAAQTAARLGRSVEARIARLAPVLRGAGSETQDRPQSEHRLASESADPTLSITDSPRGISSTVGETDRFDAVITFVDPRSAGWFADTAWRDLMTPNGTLTVITHSDHDQGGLIDPSSVLAPSARRAQLAPLDHVVLLKVPIRRSVLTAPSLSETAGPPTPDEADTARPCHTRIHADLYVYVAHEATSAAPARETSP